MRSRSARCYFIKPAAVSARVMTAPTSIAGRRGARCDLAWVGDTAIGQGIALISGAGGEGNAAGGGIVIVGVAATGFGASRGW